MTGKCENIVKALSDYAAGKGSPRVRAAMRRHLDGCPGCAEELRAIERTANLLSSIPMEAAPDLWDAIRPNLTPRRAPGSLRRLLYWVGAHRLQSAVAATAATIVLAAMLLTGPQQAPPQVDAEIYYTTHASMSWREPFADKAGLGLAAVVPVNAESGEIR